MKCFIITMIFFCFTVIVYSQSTFPYPKGIQQYKNNLPPLWSSKNYITNVGTGNSSKSINQNNIPCYKPDMSVIAVMPTLKFWVLPVNIPNPFMKEEY
jgi:hypothetical protein